MSEVHDAVVSVPNSSCIRVPGVHAIRHLVMPPSTKWLTGRVATPAATLLLLPRFVDDWVVERCLDHALVNRLVTVAALRDLIEQTSPRAVHRRQLLLDLVDARTEGMGHRSGKEQRTARWLRMAGLTRWIPNYKVPVNRDAIEVDFGWVSIRVALEVSPFYTHGTRAAQERDAQRRRLLVAKDWRVIEATDDDLANERAFARIVAILRALGAT